jgi:hypothetical protein
MGTAAPLGSQRKAPGGAEGAVASARADLAGRFAETEDCTLGIELHLLQLWFLITLLAALNHHSLQRKNIGILERWNID